MWPGGESFPARGNAGPLVVKAPGANPGWPGPGAGNCLPGARTARARGLRGDRSRGPGGQLPTAQSHYSQGALHCPHPGHGRPVGREGPVATIGAALGSSLGRFLKLSPEKIRVALACGAAGASRQPSIPLCRHHVRRRDHPGAIQIAYPGPIALASIIAVITAHRIWTGFPRSITPGFEFVNPGELGLYLILGLWGGLLAILFMRGVTPPTLFSGDCPCRSRCKPGLGGLGLGLIGLWCPHVFGVGYDSINLALTGKLTLDFAALILLAKWPATAICLGSMSGGVFGPSLFSAARPAPACPAAQVISAAARLKSDRSCPGWAVGSVVSGVTWAHDRHPPLLSHRCGSHQIPLLISCAACMMTVKFLSMELHSSNRMIAGRGIHLVRDWTRHSPPEGGRVMRLER